MKTTNSVGWHQEGLRDPNGSFFFSSSEFWSWLQGLACWLLLVAACLLLLATQSHPCPNNWINRQKCFELQLGDPSPNQDLVLGQSPGRYFCWHFWHLFPAHFPPMFGPKMARFEGFLGHAGCQNGLNRPQNGLKTLIYRNPVLSEPVPSGGYVAIPALAQPMLHHS